jgi:hypothetical protein
MSGVWTAVATVAVGAYSADQARKGANNAARAGSAANDAALRQNQQQFEASQALQQQLAEMSIGAQMEIANQQMGLQRDIANQQIAETQRQFGEVQRVLSPFITAGNNALGPLQQIQQTGQDSLQGQRALIGLNGAQAQQAAIQGLSNSPEMAAYLQQGENAILQNASATGGLRGGNTQAALGQFRPQLLAGMISQQYDRLGGLTGLGANTSTMLYQTGQNAAAGQASAGMQVAGQVGSALSGYSQGIGNAYGQLSSGTANAYSGLANSSAANNAGMAGAYNQYYNNQGSIAAGNALAQSQANIGMANSISGALGSYATLQAIRGGGFSSNPNTAALAQSGTNYSLASGANTGGLGLRAM